jgi:vacuolar-type H+-ATPase subunit E/Vma4
MNKHRRADIAAALLLIEQAKDILDNVRDAERETFDNMPENLQGSTRGEACDAAASNLEDACDALEQVTDSLNSAAE